MMSNYSIFVTLKLGLIMLPIFLKSQTTDNSNIYQQKDSIYEADLSVNSKSRVKILQQKRLNNNQLFVFGLVKKDSLNFKHKDSITYIESTNDNELCFVANYDSNLNCIWVNTYILRKKFLSSYSKYDFNVNSSQLLSLKNKKETLKVSLDGSYTIQKQTYYFHLIYHRNGKFIFFYRHPKKAYKLKFYDKNDKLLKIEEYNKHNELINTIVK